MPWKSRSKVEREAVARAVTVSVAVRTGVSRVSEASDASEVSGV